MKANLDEIFDNLQEILKGYSPPLVERIGGTPNKKNYHLWSEKNIEIDGRKAKKFISLG